MSTKTNFFYVPINFHSFNLRSFSLLFVFQFFFIHILIGQQNLPCYSIAKQTDQFDQLHEYNQIEKVWKNLGSTDTYDIESIAVDYQNSIIYAINGGSFGIINPITAKFTEINELGSCSGVYGDVLVDDICSITYDENNNVLYAVHRNGLNNGILFKVNPETGEIFTDEFVDDNNMPVDYAKIEGVQFGSPQVNYITNIADVAYQNQSKLLYVMYSDGNVRIIANISLENGSVESQTNLIYKEISGMGFDDMGNLKATTIPNVSLNSLSSLYIIDIFSSNANYVGVIDNDINMNFRCIDCAKKVQLINNCDTEINLTNYSPTENTYSATEVINSNANITAQTEYKAVNSINLNAYFEVNADINFSAIIQNTCE